MATIIGHTEYQSLLREIISYSLPLLTTIPISGIDNSMLGSEIAVSETQDSNTKRPSVKSFSNKHDVYRSNNPNAWGEFSL